MRRVILFSAILAAMAWHSAPATIINVPDDYPTIQQGIDASSDGDTVLVQPGTFIENINFNGHNIVLGSLFLTTRDTSYVSSTVIDGNSSGSVVKFENGEDSTTTIIGFTLQNGYAYETNGGGILCFSSNPIITNNIIRDNYTHGSISAGGGGIFCTASNPRIINNTIEDNRVGGMFTYGGGIYSNCFSNYIIGNRIIDNSADEGGGILCGNSATIANNIIVGNSADFGAGIVCSYLENALIINNTVTQNSSYSNGGGIVCFVSSPAIVNSIVYGNGPDEIYADMHSTPDITYCDVGGGWEGVGNIDADPLFRDTENGNFRLMFTECGDPFDSPCIDAGDPSLFDNILDCDWGLGTELSDMGAYGGEGIPTGILDEKRPVIPSRFLLHQNYPNPFNATTVIRYSLPEAGSVTVSVYNLLGQRVVTLYNGDQQAGYHQVVWDAEDNPSGVYFYRLKARDCQESMKCLLLK